MYWSDADLFEWAQKGGITPFDPLKHTTWIGSKQRTINPASIDLCLGDTVRKMLHYTDPPIVDYDDEGAADRVWGKKTVFSELILLPGEVALLCTREFVRIPGDAVGVLFLKSSAGRKALEHLHAGFVDPNWPGELTLEIANLSGVSWRLRPGDKLVQLAISDMRRTPVNSYTETGRYVQQHGATAFLPERERV